MMAWKEHAGGYNAYDANGDWARIIPDGDGYEWWLGGAAPYGEGKTSTLEEAKAAAEAALAGTADDTPPPPAEQESDSPEHEPVGTPTGAAKAEILEAGRKALVRIRATHGTVWDDYVIVGRALRQGQIDVLGSADADPTELTRKKQSAWRKWRAANGFSKDVLDKGDASRLLQCMQYLEELMIWRNTQAANVKDKLNNPTTVWRKFKEYKFGKRTPQPSVLKVENERLKFEVMRLDEENHALRGGRPDDQGQRLFAETDTTDDIARTVAGTLRFNAAKMRCVAAKLVEMAAVEEAKES
jgi:hypothetical protein